MKVFLFFGLMFLYPFIFSPIIYADGNFTDSVTKENVSQITNQQIDSITKSLARISEKNDLSQWLGTLVALGLGVAGIFSLPELIKKRFYERPEFNVSIKLENPDCLKIPVTSSAGSQLYETFYLRFKVENTGNYKLEAIELIALELYKKSQNGRYSKVTQFLPMNLKWANFGELTMPTIPPLLYKHCDLGHIIQNPNPFVGENQLLQRFGLLRTSNVVLILDTQVTPNTGSNYLLPGEYKLKIVVAANNLKPRYQWYKITLSNVWTSNEQQMLQNNIHVKKTAGI